MAVIVRLTEENRNQKESIDSNVNRAPYSNNVENFNDRRNQKLSSKVRTKVLKAASKINW